MWIKGQPSPIKGNIKPRGICFDVILLNNKSVGDRMNE